MLNLLRVLGPVLLPGISSCYQELATKAKEERLFPKAKSKKEKNSSGERNYMRQKEQTDEMDEFRSHLDMSPSSFILPGKSPEGRDGSTITSELENQAAEDGRDCVR